MIHPAPPPRIDSPLTLPVGRLAAPIEPVDHFASLATVAQELQESAVPALAVVRDGVYIGLVTEPDLARALAVGLDPHAPVSEVVTLAPPPLRGYETGAHALRILTEHQTPALAVCDDFGRVLGLVLPSRLLAPPHQEARPRLVGGMATPLGVYLTTGAVSGGVPRLALVLTGATMFAMFLVGIVLTQVVATLLPQNVIQIPAVQTGLEALALVVFLVILRSVPLAGYHGAEHMVVHAIERNEPLTPEVVRRMPRVHPRCGTNYAVAATLFLTIFFWEWVPSPELRLITAFLVTMAFFRPLGSLAQYYLTTKAPNDKQLASGIAAGKNLLHNYQTARNNQVGPVMRLVNSGIFHIIAGSLLASIVYTALMAVLRVPPQWQVPLGI